MKALPVLCNSGSRLQTRNKREAVRSIRATSCHAKSAEGALPTLSPRPLPQWPVSREKASQTPADKRGFLADLNLKPGSSRVFWRDDPSSGRLLATLGCSGPHPIAVTGGAYVVGGGAP